MPALAVGQSSSCSNPILDIFAQVNGVLTDLFALEYQVVETISDPDGGAQIFPSTPGAYEPVTMTDCPTGDRLGPGHYVARFTVPLDALPGSSKIRWRMQLTASSAVQTYAEEFEVLPEVEATGVDEAYAFVSQLRADGVTTMQASDARLQRLIEFASRTIDELTGLFFSPRELTIDLDGMATPSMFLDMPIIALSEAYIESQAVELTSLVVYNRHLTQRLTRPDDRRNPLITRRDGARWPKGPLNVRLVGVFGFTDPTGAPMSQGRLPPSINQACRLLVVRELEALASPDRVASRRENDIRSETTRDQSVTYGERRGSSAAATYGSTGDPEIDAILARFRPPMKMAMV